MKQYIGMTVYAAGESKPMTIEEYRGRNAHQSHMFLVRLASKATRLYAAQRLTVRNGRKVAPLLPQDAAA